MPEHLIQSNAWKQRADFAALSAWLIASVYITFTSLTSSWTDFRCYYAAARVLAAGGNPYDYNQLAPVLLSVTGYIGSNPYYYPPWFAWSFTPISWLPFQTARCIWIIFNSMLWIISLWQLSNIINWPARGWRRWLMFFIATYFFLLTTLRYEQIGIVLFALVVAVISAVKKQQWNLAGVLLALLLVKPHITSILVIAISVWLIRFRQWRPVIVMCTSTFILFIVATIATPDWYQPFFQSGFGNRLYYYPEGTNGVRVISHTTLLDWLARFNMGDVINYSIYYLAVIAGLLFIAFVIFKSNYIIEVAAASILVSFAIAPYAFAYDFPPLTVALFWATALYTSSKRALAGGVVISIFILGIIVQDGLMSDSYWIIIGLSGLAIWGWLHADLQEIPEKLLH